LEEPTKEQLEQMEKLDEEAHELLQEFSDFVYNKWEALLKLHNNFVPAAALFLMVYLMDLVALYAIGSGLPDDQVMKGLQMALQQHKGDFNQFMAEGAEKLASGMPPEGVFPNTLGPKDPVPVAKEGEA